MRFDKPEGLSCGANSSGFLVDPVYDPSDLSIRHFEFLGDPQIPHGFFRGRLSQLSESFADRFMNRRGLRSASSATLAGRLPQTLDQRLSFRRRFQIVRISQQREVETSPKTLFKCPPNSVPAVWRNSCFLPAGIILFRFFPAVGPRRACQAFLERLKFISRVISNCLLKVGGQRNTLDFGARGIGVGPVRQKSN